MLPAAAGRVSDPLPLRDPERSPVLLPSSGRAAGVSTLVQKDPCPGFTERPRGPSRGPGPRRGEASGPTRPTPDRRRARVIRPMGGSVAGQRSVGGRGPPRGIWKDSPPRSGGRQAGSRRLVARVGRAFALPLPRITRVADSACPLRRESGRSGRSAPPGVGGSSRAIEGLRSREAPAQGAAPGPGRMDRRPDGPTDERGREGLFGRSQRGLLCPLERSSQ